MLTSELTLRVRYGETDRMGYVYYGNYAAYFEVARVEMLREAGITYRDLEDSGIALPVAEYKIKYHKPAFYDDVLKIKTTVKQMPGVRLHFEYQTFRSDGTLLNTAETTLVFVNTETGKPCNAPDDVLEKISSQFR
jgi:acyl-CoA thioester hydrolase